MNSDNSQTKRNFIPREEIEEAIQELKEIIENTKIKARRDSREAKHSDSIYYSEEMQGYFRGVSELGNKISSWIYKKIEKKLIL